WSGAALFADPEDPSAWTDALHRLARDGEQRVLLGRLARGRAERFSQQRQLEGILETYREASLVAARRAAWATDSSTTRFIRYTRAITSDWNHRNAHYQRGVLRELKTGGHDVLARKPENGWSRQNQLREQGPETAARLAREYTDLSSTLYDNA